MILKTKLHFKQRVLFNLLNTPKTRPTSHKFLQVKINFQIEGKKVSLNVSNQINHEMSFSSFSCKSFSSFLTFSSTTYLRLINMIFLSLEQCELRTSPTKLLHQISRLIYVSNIFLNLFCNAKKLSFMHKMDVVEGEKK